MQRRPELIVVDFQVSEFHYLHEQISQINGKTVCNKNAFSLAVTDALESMGFTVNNVISIFQWNVSGDFLGKNYCKIYIDDFEAQEQMYQAEIPECHYQKIAERKSFAGNLSFARYQHSPPRKTLLTKLRSLISTKF